MGQLGKRRGFFSFGRRLVAFTITLLMVIGLAPILPFSTTVLAAATVNIEGVKTMTSDVAAPSETFYFTLIQVSDDGSEWTDGDPITADAQVVGAGSFSFTLDELTDNTYYFKIAETPGSAPGWDYDPASYIVKVVVTNGQAAVYYPGDAEGEHGVCREVWRKGCSDNVPNPQEEYITLANARYYNAYLQKEGQTDQRLYGVFFKLLPASLWPEGVAPADLLPEHWSESDVIYAICANSGHRDAPGGTDFGVVNENEVRSPRHAMFAFALFDESFGAKLTLSEFEDLFGFGLPGMPGRLQGGVATTGSAAGTPFTVDDVRKVMIQFAVYHYSMSPIGLFYQYFKDTAYEAHFTRMINVIDELIYLYNDNSNGTQVAECPELVYTESASDAMAGTLEVNGGNMGAMKLTWTGSATVGKDGSPVQNGSLVVSGDVLDVTIGSSGVVFKLEALQLLPDSITGSIIWSVEDVLSGADPFIHQAMLTSCAGFVKCEFTLGFGEEAAGRVEFTNVYTPQEITPPPSGTISATKKATGRSMDAQQFSFTLYESNEDGVEIEEIETATNASSGTESPVNFEHEFTFGGSGSYYYLIKETGTGGGGWTIDERSYLIRIEVQCECGHTGCIGGAECECECGSPCNCMPENLGIAFISYLILGIDVEWLPYDSESVVFENTFTSSTTQDPVSTTLTVTKTVEGTNTDQAFAFTITFSGGGLGNITSSRNPLFTSADGGRTWTGTLSHGQRVTFSGISAGTTYTVIETQITGYTESVTGARTGTVGNNTVAFTNTYDSSSVTEDEDDEPPPTPTTPPDDDDDDTELEDGDPPLADFPPPGDSGLPATGINSWLTVLAILLGIALLGMGAVLKARKNQAKKRAE